MNCPRCPKELTHRTVAGIELDVCTSGCAGIWFDQHELKRLDSPEDFDASELYEIKPTETVQINTDDRVDCPLCVEVTMMRHFYGAKKRVEIDTCPNCAGVWLDAHEIFEIHKLYPSDAEREKAFRELYQDMFGAEVLKIRQESKGQLEEAQSIYNVFRFITPSFYIRKMDGFLNPPREHRFRKDK